MPITVGFGGEARCCGGGPGSGVGPGTGVALACCDYPTPSDVYGHTVPRRLYATLTASTVPPSPWDGITVPLDYVYDASAMPYPDRWRGIHTGAPCGTVTGPGPFQLSLDMFWVSDAVGNPPNGCAFAMYMTDITPDVGGTIGNVWCRPTGFTLGGSGVSACSPFSLNLDGYQTAPSSGSTDIFTCDGCGAGTGPGSGIYNVGVTVTE